MHLLESLVIYIVWKKKHGHNVNDNLFSTVVNSLENTYLLCSLSFRATSFNLTVLKYANQEMDKNIIQIIAMMCAKVIYTLQIYFTYICLLCIQKSV